MYFDAGGNGIYSNKMGVELLLFMVLNLKIQTYNLYKWFPYGFP
jgi:hypothetical protein